jgi:hypothetical protein
MLKKTPRGVELRPDELQKMRTREERLTEFHDVRLAQEDRRKLLKHVEWLNYQIELRDDECERLRRSL